MLTPWPCGSGVLRAQTALLGRVERDRASPARFWAAAGALAGAPGRTPEVSPLSPVAGAAAPIRLCHFMCDRISAGSPRQLTDLSTLVPTGGTVLGRLCLRRGGAGGRAAACQGFVLPKLEQGNQTQTSEGS